MLRHSSKLRPTGGRGRLLPIGIAIAALAAFAAVPTSAPAKAYASTSRLFGSYKGSPQDATWVAAERQRYGALTMVAPAWVANDFSPKAPSDLFLTSAKANGIYAALSVCSTKGGWLADVAVRTSWSLARGTACVSYVASNMGTSVNDVQAVIDGSEIDEYATPAQQVAMYQVIKQYFPNADVISYNAGEIICGGDQLGNMVQYGCFGSHGRSADAVLLQDNGNWYEENAAAYLSTRESPSLNGPTKLYFFRDYPKSQAEVDQRFAELTNVERYHHVDGFEIRAFRDMDPAAMDGIAARVNVDSATFLGS